MAVNIPRPVLKDNKALVIGIANEHSIAYGCARRFASWAPTSRSPISTRKPVRTSSPSLAGSSADLPPARCRYPRGARRRCSRRVKDEMGARHPGPFDRIRAEGGSAGRTHRLLGGRILRRDGRVVPLVRAHGEARRSADDRWRHDVRDELPRREQGGTDVQRDGPGEGGPRGVLSLPRVPARSTPPSTYSVSPDRRRAYGVARYAQVKPTSMMSTSSPIGARCAASLSSRSKSFRPEAARVFSGPGEIACTRMPLRPELVGEIAAAGFERRLHRAHHVVVRHDLVRAVVAHREHRAAVLHQRRRELRHAHERVAGHVHRLREARRRAVEQAALQVFLRREGDRVHEDVEPAPLLRRSSSNTASSSPGCATSSGRKIGASSSRASGSTCGRAFSLR